MVMAILCYEFVEVKGECCSLALRYVNAMHTVISGFLLNTQIFLCCILGLNTAAV